MCHRSQVEADARDGAILRERALGKVGAVIRDDVVWDAVAHRDILDEPDSCRLVQLLGWPCSNFLIGRASIHLVNLSTATSKCVMPPRAVLKGPTMLSPQTAKGQAIGMVRSAEAGWQLRLLKRWHPSHLRTSGSASWRVVGQ